MKLLLYDPLVCPAIHCCGPYCFGGIWSGFAAAALHRDLAFDGSISGNVYAQPLYIEGGPGGRAMVIAVTESINV